MKAIFIMSTSNLLCYKLHNYHMSGNNGVLAQRAQVGRHSLACN